MQFTIIETTLIIVLTALTVSVVFRALRLPVILGYLVVGALVGPHVLGWLPDAKGIKDLAEFGIALLMFSIGLEFSLSKLIALRYSVFVLGGLQVLISIAITASICLALKMSGIESAVIGCVVAMSSTAIVIKQLSGQFELQSKHGLSAVSILLFQDLSVIPILILMASLSGAATGSFTTVILWALLKGIIAILVILSLGKWLLRPLFHIIASTRIVELFTLSALFIAIGSAWFTNAMGASYAMGAFLAGIMLGETEFRHQIEIEIRPFRDVLLGLFFVSIGMLVNITTWLDTWVWILLLLVAMMIGKTLLITLLCRFSKHDMVSATRTGVVLSQGGEFGFAILTVALANNLLPPSYGQVVLAALLITFALAPIIIRYNGKLAKLLFPKLIKVSHEEIKAEIKTLSGKLSNHVIICGYGRVGQNIARFLTKVNRPYIGLDLDPKIIHNATLAGDRVAYGNATHIDILKIAQLEKAATVVISFDDAHAAASIASQIHQTNPDLPILVRCKGESEFKALHKSGATKVVAEVFEESLSLVGHLLHMIHVSKTKIAALLQETRNNNYALLYQVFPGSFDEEVTEKGAMRECLRPVVLLEGTHAVMLTLEELGLQNVEVIAIHHGKKRLQPEKNVALYAGDILILYGLPSHLDIAETVLQT